MKLVKFQFPSHKLQIDSRSSFLDVFVGCNIKGGVFPQKPTLPENKGGCFVINGDRFGLPLGPGGSFSAKTRTPGK